MAKVKMLNAKALVNLKYDKSCYKIGEKLKVRVNETEEMVEKGCIVLVEEVPKDNEQDGNGDDDSGDPHKDGE